MAGEWIKVELATPDKPEVLRLSRILGIDKDAVFGKLIRLWAWFDKNSVDGVVDGVVDADIDSLCFQPGFATALVSVKWLEIDTAAERITLPNFERHNGESAKKRALKTERQSRWRQNVDANVDTPASTQPTTPESTEPSTREEKRREDKYMGETFDQFWDVWPKKVNKEKARQAWRKVKLTDELFAFIIAAVESQKRSADWQKNGGEFIPHASTWINGKRWEDQQAVEIRRVPEFSL